MLFKAFMRHLPLVFVVLAGCSLGTVEQRIVSADEPLPEDLQQGDVVSRAGVEVTVPEPGQQVQIVGEMDDGTSIELTVRNPLDSIVEIVDSPEEPLVLGAGSTAPCQDGAFNLAGHKWTTTYQWKFQAGSTPAGNSQGNVELALRNAANAITTQRNDCGFADQVSATHTYLGRTTAAPNIRGTTTAVTCGGADGTNSIGFGALPTGFLAVACSWTDGAGHAVEGDIKYNTRHSWYALDVPAGCNNRFGVQAVGAHELGHVFGLAHVSETSHPNLTMSTAARACSNAPLSLGLGDVRALRQLY